MPAYSDEQLVLEALDDSHLAFGQLVRQYQYRVLRTIASIISDEEAAQDVAQETFLSAWSNLAKLKEQQKFGRWLNQIAISFSRRWLRDQRKHQENTVSFDESAVVLMQELRYQSEKLRQEIWEAIDELSQDYREAVVLHYISGYSYKEISQMLSVPVSTVRGRLQQARNQLRKEFLDMVTKLQLEIDSTVHKFLKERAKQDGVSIEGLIIRLIERYKRDMDSPEIAVRKVPLPPLTYARGAPSPDGRYLSFTEWASGNLAVRDLTTGEYRNLTSEGTRVGSHLVQWANNSTWSPDSKQAAYAWYHKHKGLQLCIVGLDGSEPRVLYPNESKEVLWLRPHEWSRDGKSILALFWRETALEIVLVSVADGSVRVLKSSNHDFWTDKISLSPDGRYVVYDCYVKRDARGIFLLATDGSGEIPLTEHPADDYYPVWSPDGKAIVFVSERSGTYDAWLLQMTDGKPVGEPTLIKRDIGEVYPMGFTRSGSLYYSIDAGGQNIYVATLDPGTGELLSPPTKAIWRSEGFNRAPAWSPDGKYLAYLSRRPRAVGAIRHRVLVIRSLETGEERELHAEARKAGGLHWSPEGRSILIKLEEGFNLIDVQTGDETPITRELVLPKCAWSPDGKTLFYLRWIGPRVESEGPSYSVMAHDLETGREQELRRDIGGGRGFAISPDGRQLFLYIRRSVDSAEWSYSIVVHDLETGREQELCRDICHPHEPGAIGVGPDLGISPDGRQLTFSPGDFNTGERLLKVMPAAGGEPRELLRLKDPERYCGSWWMPDGRYILFGTRRRSPDHPDEPVWIPAPAGGGKRRKFYEPVELWSIPAEGGEPQKLLAIHKGSNLSIHPDGQRIAFAAGEEESEVWAMENFLAQSPPAK